MLLVIQFCVNCLKMYLKFLKCIILKLIVLITIKKLNYCIKADFAHVRLLIKFFDICSEKVRKIVKHSCWVPYSFALLILLKLY